MALTNTFQEQLRFVVVSLRFQKPCNGFAIFAMLPFCLGGACHLSSMRHLAQTNPNMNRKDNGTKSNSSHDCLGKTRANQQCPGRFNPQIPKRGMLEQQTTLPVLHNKIYGTATCAVTQDLGSDSLSIAPQVRQAVCQGRRRAGFQASGAI